MSSHVVTVLFKHVKEMKELLINMCSMVMSL